MPGAGGGGRLPAPEEGSSPAAPGLGQGQCREGCWAVHLGRRGRKPRSGCQVQRVGKPSGRPQRQGRARTLEAQRGCSDAPPSREENGPSGQSLPWRGEAVWPASQQGPQVRAHGSPPVCECRAAPPSGFLCPLLRAVSCFGWQGSRLAWLGLGAAAGAPRGSWEGRGFRRGQASAFSVCDSGRASSVAAECTRTWGVWSWSELSNDNNLNNNLFIFIVNCTGVMLANATA